MTSRTTVVFVILTVRHRSNATETVTLPLKAHVPTTKESSHVASVDIRIVEERGVTVVGVSTGSEEYVVERAVEQVRGGGKKCLPCRLNKTSTRPPSQQPNP